MYIEPGFYELVPGAIGTIHYAKDISKKIPEDQRQAFVSRQAGERMRAFLMNATYGMNGNSQMSPEDAYIKARKDSWSELEEGPVCRDVVEQQVQVGQKESYDKILKIEQGEDFIEWMNPLLVMALKEAYTKNNV